MSQILYISSLVGWSLSGIMTPKLVIRESESPRPAASSILISRMTSSSVIIPYILSQMQGSTDWGSCNTTIDVERKNIVFNHSLPHMISNNTSEKYYPCKHTDGIYPPKPILSVHPGGKQNTTSAKHDMSVPGITIVSV